MMNNKKKCSILLVDDDKTNISELRRILSPDYTIYASSDGEGALETAEEFVPDVILLDIIMPDMDGYEVISALKSNEKTKDIPVIFITGLDSADDERKGLALGAADYIAKPFHSSIVKMRVGNQINLINRLDQQALMTRVSSSFLTDAHIDSLFADNLRMVGEFMDVAQVLLFKLEGNDNSFVCQSEWINPDLFSGTRIGTKFQLEEPFLSTVNTMLENSKLCISSNDSAYNEAMKPYRLKFQNYISAPIFIKGKMSAIIDFAKEDDGRNWNESELNLAVLVAGTFSGVFERSAIEYDLNVVTKLQSDLVTAKEYAELSREVAEHSNRAKSEFLSRMSHEMRTPMNAIMGMMQVVKLRGVPDNLKKSIEEIDHASRQLLDLIDDLLDLSGMEYGVLKLTESVFDFNDMLTDPLKTAEHNATEKQQIMNVDIDPALLTTFKGDERYLKRVVTCLLSNAIKFTPEKGEITFTANKLEEDFETITLQIRVADSGIGIADDQKDMIFDIFEQIDGSNTRKQGGIGVGLPLVKRITEMMGGDVRVESEPGKGADFFITCKLIKDK